VSAPPETVLAFWFAEGMAARWFEPDPAFDAEVRSRLEPLYHQAVAGELDAWAAGARGALALVILLDQVPRNFYRGDPRAFAGDARALAVTKDALARGLDRELAQAERMFLYMPLEHCEELPDQELCVELMGRLDEDPKWRDYALRHRDIIARFGRFPHRNAALGRESTVEEEAFLKQPGSSF
jgi:uncharacterized protein (DUF924 family)